MNFKDFSSSLTKINSKRILFVALGNELRGDDGSSFHFIDKLKDTKEFQLSNYLSVGTNPENYLDRILDYKADLIVFIDAARFGGKPGEIRWLDNEKIDSLNISTHSFSIKLVEEYLLSHGNFEIKYLGIEPYKTGFGDKISSILSKAIDYFFLV